MILIEFFNVIIYQPLLNSLVLIYQYLPGHDFGIAIIVLTLIIRLILYPSSVKSIKSQKALSKLQPKIKEIQEKYKKDKEKIAKKTMELYQKEKINPFSGCLPLLIQLPILIGFFQVFRRGFGKEQMAYLYSFVSQTEPINQTFLGIIDLAHSTSIENSWLWPNIVLVVLAGFSQFIQTKMLSSNQKKKGGSKFGEMFQKQMLYFFPFFMILILWRLPSAIALYWLISNLFMILQQYLIKNGKGRS